MAIFKQGMTPDDDEGVRASIDRKHYDPVEHPRPSQYKDLILPPYWYCNVKPNGQKRKHRKREGRLDLCSLNRMISTAWKRILVEEEGGKEKPDVMSYCKRLAAIGAAECREIMISRADVKAPSPRERERMIGCSSAGDVNTEGGSGSANKGDALVSNGGGMQFAPPANLQHYLPPVATRARGVIDMELADRYRSLMFTRYNHFLLHPLQRGSELWPYHGNMYFNPMLSASRMMLGNHNHLYDNVEARVSERYNAMLQEAAHNEDADTLFSMRKDEKSTVLHKKTELLSKVKGDGANEAAESCDRPEKKLKMKKESDDEEDGKQSKKRGLSAYSVFFRLEHLRILTEKVTGSTAHKCFAR